MDEGARFCIRCGAAQGDTTAAPESMPPPPPHEPGPTPPYTTGVERPKSKIAAGVLGIVLGGLGIHRFYLGYNTIGIVQLLLGVLGFATCGISTIAAMVWGIIDGILILTGSIRTDAQGRPLVD